MFDDPAENERGQPPFLYDLARQTVKPGRAMHNFFFENLRNPAPVRRAGPTSQVYSSFSVRLDSVRSKIYII
jgi:hypothetical protein